MKTMKTHKYPVIIQGGMGAAVSGWQLARAVSLAGQLGVVSGTALDVVLARRLQLGDRDGHLRRAVERFPYPDVGTRILQRYFVAGGKSQQAAFKSVPMLATKLTQDQIELLVVANFVEVYLAREGHAGSVGINYLEKIQLPTLASLFGAMLAGVDYVLMGAGIPIAIPGMLDQLSKGCAVELPVAITSQNGNSDRPVSRFDPMCITGGERVKLDRPQFLAIVASATLATMLSRKATGRVDGFVVEGPTAGGHNAPPRGKLQINERGEPLYGKRDMVDLQVFQNLDVPFWLAGSHGTAERLAAALQAGAAGVQVGTAFAFCEESGLRDDIKRQVLQMSQAGDCHVFTDPLASPTGFPFKVLDLDDSLSGDEQRPRNCDLGFLRQGFAKDDGTNGWRCPAEPVATYVRKGGELEDTVGRKCLCNALLANVGLGQVRGGECERPLVTCGDDVTNIRRWLPSANATSYSAADVIERLLANKESSALLPL
jgi:nitronate monooxygenase